MTGLEKIKEEILAEADQTAKEKLEAAHAEAEAILNAAKAESDTLSSEIVGRAESEQQVIEERSKSSVEMQERQTMLRTKQEIITGMLEAAYETVLTMEDAAYFDMIYKMLNSFALPKEGKIYFSKKDLERIPAGFEEKVADIAAAKGGALEVSKEPKNLDGGFILVYGGIEENCSIKAIFREKRDELADTVHAVLFAGEK